LDLICVRSVDTDPVVLIFFRRVDQFEQRLEQVRSLQSPPEL
jgi:hypothetical protein